MNIGLIIMNLALIIFYFLIISAGIYYFYNKIMYSLFSNSNLNIIDYLLIIFCLPLICILLILYIIYNIFIIVLEGIKKWI